MKTRRDVMPLIAGGAAAVAWPLAARAQQAILVMLLPSRISGLKSWP